MLKKMSMFYLKNYSKNFMPSRYFTFTAIAAQKLNVLKKNNIYKIGFTTATTSKSSFNNNNTNSYCQMAVCWNCHGKIPHKLDVNIFCENCGSILEIDKQLDYFMLMGIENKFSINQNELTTKFRLLQYSVHPDKFGNKSEHEQTLSADWSSLINEAYRTLLVPLKRGEYILKQHNIIIAEDNNSVDKEFLMEIMERNEEIVEANTSVDIMKLFKKLCTDRQNIIENLQNSLEIQNLNKAKECIISLRYFTSLENSIKEKATKIGVLIQ